MQPISEVVDTILHMTNINIIMCNHNHCYMDNQQYR